jgi:hypothetical protein
MVNIFDRFIFASLMGLFFLLTDYSSAKASAAWPNEPNGANVLTDWTFNSIAGSGWNTTGGDIMITNDSTAPLSPGNVLQFRYPIGFTAGIAPGRVFFSLGGERREVYLGFWWKPSYPWQQEVNSGTSKIDFLISNGPADMFSGMMGPQGGPHYLVTGLEFPSISNGHLPGTSGDNPGHRTIIPNVAYTQLTLGQWHRIEKYIKYSTTKTSRDGILRIWIDGVLNVNHTSVNYDTDWPFVEFNLSPTWGGMNNKKTQTDYYWFDHVHLSLPNGGSSTPTDQPPGPPAAPRILNVTVQ